jgi:hypothetical protein
MLSYPILSIHLSIYLSDWNEASLRDFPAQLQNEAIQRNFLKECKLAAPKQWNDVRLPQYLKLTTSKTKQFCETSFKNGKLSAELTASYQLVLHSFSRLFYFRALWSSFFWLLTLSLLWLFCCCVWHLFILSEIRLLKLPSVAAGAPFSVAFLSYCISWTKTDRSRPMKILGTPGSQNCVRPCTFLQLIKTDRAAAKWIWMGISDE